MTQTATPSENSFEATEARVLEAIARAQRVLGGLKKLENCPAAEWMTMDTATMARKSPQQMAEAAVGLAQFAADLQKNINAATAQRNYLRNRLESAAAAKLTEVPDNICWSDKRAYVQATDALCKKIAETLRHCELVVDSLAYMPQEVHKVSQCIHNLKLTHIATERAYDRQ